MAGNYFPVIFGGENLEFNQSGELVHPQDVNGTRLYCRCKYLLITKTQMDCCMGTYRSTSLKHFSTLGGLKRH